MTRDGEVGAVWESDNDDDGERAVFQDDGNLVIYNADNEPVWATDTYQRGNIQAIQDDGNVVIYDGVELPIWATNTQEK
ncbi:hypothetical protein ACH347_36815 [Saccharopolyspora sp. 5N102]|uniref:hypothetical protein n=1 Tax=Saccharopolyspora sp. 5N102 TaxID=3375155 RepID=UPI00379F3AEE